MFFRLYLPPGSGRLRQPATIDPTLDLCTRYLLRLSGPRQCGFRSLPDTSTHGQHWESNPRPSDLESNALSTWPRAPTNDKKKLRKLVLTQLYHLQITILDLEPNPCFQTLLIISKTYHWIFSCNTSKHRSGQELLFIFFDLRAPTSL